MPLGFVLTVVIGAAISALHGLIILPIPIATSWLNYLHISSMWTVAAYVAFWREYQMRRSFAPSCHEFGPPMIQGRTTGPSELCIR
jgi:hypothetical protein